MSGRQTRVPLHFATSNAAAAALCITGPEPELCHAAGVDARLPQRVPSGTLPHGAIHFFRRGIYKFSSSPLLELCNA